MLLKKQLRLSLLAIVFIYTGAKAQQTGEKKGWSSEDRHTFINSCIETAKEGMSHDSARFYCYCMEELIEHKYPNVEDVAKLQEGEFNKPEWQDKVAGCLGGTWKSEERNVFLENCISSAKDGGIDAVKATNYCECMLFKIEKMYPDALEAGEVLSKEDLKSPAWQKLIKSCLDF